MKNRDAYKMGQIKKALKELNFDLYTNKRKAKDKKRFGFIEPDVPRMRDSRKQISYIKEIEGYRITLHTSYDPKSKRFTRHNQIWTVVSDVTRKLERVYINPFRRVGDSFIARVIDELKFLDELLENRPLDSNNKLMHITEKNPVEYEWISVDKKQKESLYYQLPLSVMKGHMRRTKSRLYYEQRRNPETPRARDLRKTHRITNEK